MIVTVTGEIPKEKLGFTLPHEHILIDLRPVVEESAEEHFHEKLKSVDNLADVGITLGRDVGK